MVLFGRLKFFILQLLLLVIITQNGRTGLWVGFRLKNRRSEKYPCRKDFLPGQKVPSQIGDNRIKYLPRLYKGSQRASPSKL